MNHDYKYENMSEEDRNALISPFKKARADAEKARIEEQKLNAAHIEAERKRHEAEAIKAAWGE